MKFHIPKISFSRDLSNTHEEEMFACLPPHSTHLEGNQKAKLPSGHLLRGLIRSSEPLLPSWTPSSSARNHTAHPADCWVSFVAVTFPQRQGT